MRGRNFWGWLPLRDGVEYRTSIEGSTNLIAFGLSFLNFLLQIISLFKGHDTTTAGLAWTIFLLGLHPEIQDKVHNELDSIFLGSDRKVTLKDMGDMKYLERVIKESMRLYPPVPIIGRVLSEDIQLDEYRIPQGCMIKIDLFNLHRDNRFFADPERFDPERFLPEQIIRHPYAYIPFSAG